MRPFSQCEHMSRGLPPDPTHRVALELCRFCFANFGSPMRASCEGISGGHTRMVPMLKWPRSANNASARTCSKDMRQPPLPHRVKLFQHVVSLAASCASHCICPGVLQPSLASGYHYTRLEYKDSAVRLTESLDHDKTCSRLQRDCSFISRMMARMLICDCKHYSTKAGPPCVPLTYEVSEDVVRRAGLHAYTWLGTLQPVPMLASSLGTMHSFKRLPDPENG